MRGWGNAEAGAGSSSNAGAVLDGCEIPLCCINEMPSPVRGLGGGLSGADLLADCGRSAGLQSARGSE